MERYIDIPGYKGCYQVSNLGNVKSLARKKVRSNMVLKLMLNDKGYYAVNLYLSGVRKKYQVHQLVAMAFLNHKPCGMKLVVDHVNNIKTDNRLENIQIITNRENTSKDRKGGSSKYVGVYWDKNRSKWRAEIVINRKTKKLGRYDNEFTAHLAYQSALNKVIISTNDH